MPPAGAAARDALEPTTRDAPHAEREGIRALAPELIRTLSPVVHHSVERALRRHASRGRSAGQEVEDVVQTVMLVLFAERGALEAWDPGREHGLDLKRFVALVARREVDSILRSARRNPWTEEPVPADTMEAAPTSRPDPEALADARRTLGYVAERLAAQLSPLGRALFEMIFLQERTAKEVAAALGLSPAAVHTWKSRLSLAARAIAAGLDRPAPTRRVPSPAGHRPCPVPPVSGTTRA